MPRRKKDVLAGDFEQYFPPYKKTKYYSNQLYRVYDIGKLEGEPEKLLVGYIRLPDRENITLDFLPNLYIMHIPIFAWRRYSNGQIHFKGADVYNWICNRVTPPYRHGIHEMLRYCGITEYDAISLFIWADGKFSNDSFYIEKCDESKEETYRQLMKLKSFIPGEKSKTPPWF